jgi:hypothetical protein
MISLAFSWLKIEARSNIALFSAIVILFAIPELFFAGLYINPTAIAMCLIMISHFLIRRYFNGNEKWWMLLLASLIFGFGATIRWNTILYGLVIVADILWLNEGFNLKKFRQILFWGAGALFFFFLFLLIQEYPPASIIEVYNFKNYVIDVDSKIPPLLNYIQSSTFYTPTMLFISVSGLIYLLFNNKKLFLFSLLSVGLMFLLFHSFFFKMMAPVFPVFFLLITAGIKGIEAFIKSTTISRSLMFIICASFWFIGLKINNSKVWGPGFELKDKYYSYRDNTVPVVKEKYNYRLCLFDGCGYPSPEGPRPMGGYAGILLGGKWHEFMNQDRKEYNLMIDTALKNRYPFIKVEYNYYIENLLLGRGFTTKDSYKSKLAPSLGKRSYYDHRQDSIVIYQLSQKDTKDTLLLKRIIKDSKKDTFIIYSGHYGIPANLKRRVLFNKTN